LRCCAAPSSRCKREVQHRTDRGRPGGADGGIGPFGTPLSAYLHPGSTTSPGAATASGAGSASANDWLAFAGAGGLAAALLAGGALWRRRGSPGRASGRSLAAALRAIESTAAKATPRETAAELEEALRHHLEARFDIAPGTPVSQWHARLIAARVDPATATELAEVTKELHYLRYAPELAAAEELRADTLERVRRLARALR
jgi:hypothetical protein